MAREIWRRKDVDKEKIVETKQHQLEDNWNFSEKLKEKDTEIVQLKGGLDAAVGGSLVPIKITPDSYVIAL